METTTTTTTAAKAKKLEEDSTFNMGSLSTHLPQKRTGLSNYFSGKSRSFTCLADAQCIEDLKKEEPPEAKRRKYSDRQREAFLPPLSCRNESSTSSYCRSCVGV